MGWGTLADYEEVESDTGLRTQAQPLAKNANLSSSSRLLTCWSGGRKMALPGFNAAATSKQHFPSPASGAGETAQAGRRGQHRRNRTAKEGTAEAASHPRLSGNGLAAKNAWVPDTAARFRDGQGPKAAQRLAM